MSKEQETYEELSTSASEMSKGFTLMVSDPNESDRREALHEARAALCEMLHTVEALLERQ